MRVILPSSPLPDPAVFAAGLDWLRAEGVTVLPPSDWSNPEHGGPLPFLAGPDLGRAQELAGAFAVEQVDAVWCGRGGSGALRTLNALDAITSWATRVGHDRVVTQPGPGLPAGGGVTAGVAVGAGAGAGVRAAAGQAAFTLDHAGTDDAWRGAAVSRFAPERRAVPLVGLSDATALLLARLHDSPPGVAIHGPVITQLPRLDVASARALRAWISAPYTLPLLRAERPAVHVQGRAEGPLVGGNLALLASTCGTPEQPRLDGAVLLVEEIGEPAYRVDRMMAQLARSGALRGVRGLALGSFTGCSPVGGVEACLAWWARHLGVPCLGGLPVGHGAACVPVALGARYLLAADDGLLTPLEDLTSWLARTAPPPAVAAHQRAHVDPTRQA